MSHQSDHFFDRRDVLKASVGASGLSVFSSGPVRAVVSSVMEGSKATYRLTSTGGGITQRRTITSEVAGIHRDEKQVTLSVTFSKQGGVVNSDTRRTRIENLHLALPEMDPDSRRFTPLFAPEGTAVTEDGVLQKLVDPSGGRKTVLEIEESRNLTNDRDDTTLWLVPMLSPTFANPG